MSDIRKMSIAELADWESYCDDSDAGPYIAELASRLEAAEADRDRWKAEAMAARTCLMHGNRGQPIETYEAWKSARAANERGEG